MDVIDKVKNIIKGEPDPEIIEGSPEAYDRVKEMTDDQLRKYIGVASIKVPREIQEELFKRFVQPHAHYNCKECFGRGHTDWNPAIHALMPCVCLQRVIRDEVGKENKIILMN